MKRKKLWIILVFIIMLFLFFYIMSGGLMILAFRKTVEKNIPKEVLHTDINVDVGETESVDYKNAYKGSGIPDVLSQEVLDKYLKNLEPADDEYDNLFATDFQEFKYVNIYKGRDQSAYQKILGHRDATLQQIRQALDANDKISHTYKEFIYQFACDLRTLYPECNLAVLYHNLQTLVIEAMTQYEINKETLSMDSAACYLRYENRICVAEDLDLSRESDDYIIMIHELCHAARSLQWKPEDSAEYKIDIGFYDDYKMGTYAEEGVITNIAYELQGLGKRATFYPMLASYYRIITQCIDYSGEDFFNHGVNYLISQMDAFMGDKEAYQIVARIDAQMTLRYTPYQEVDFRDFQPVYDYLARMYFKKYIDPDMTREQAEEVFDHFYEEITFNLENMNRGYDISENTFINTFEQYMKGLEEG